MVQCIGFEANCLYSGLLYAVMRTEQVHEGKVLRVDLVTESAIGQH